MKVVRRGKCEIKRIGMEEVYIENNWENMFKNDIKWDI